MAGRVCSWNSRIVCTTPKTAPCIPQTLLPTFDTMVSGQNSICGYSPKIIYRHHEGSQKKISQTVALFGGQEQNP